MKDLSLYAAWFYNNKRHNLPALEVHMSSRSFEASNCCLLLTQALLIKDMEISEKGWNDFFLNLFFESPVVLLFLKICVPWDVVQFRILHKL
jgi:hypothetical protein